MVLVDSSRSPSPRRGPALAAVHLCLSVPLGSWIGRIPEIKASLGASDGQWGLANTIAALGEVAGLLLITLVIGRCSTRLLTLIAVAVVLAMGPLVAVSGTLPALIATVTLWMLAAKVLGTTSGALILVHQRALGEVIFGRFDALYSMGLLTGGLLSSLAITQGVPASHQFAITNSLLAISLLISMRSLPDETRSEPDSTRVLIRIARRFTPGLLILGGLSLLASLIDSAASHWAGIYLTTAAEGDTAAGALGYVTVMAAKTVFLLVVGRLSSTLGWMGLAVGSVVIAAMALGIGLSTGTVLGGLLSLAILGAGTAFYGPMVNTLASNAPGLTDGEARSVLEAGELPAYVLAPALVGLLASQVDIRWALLTMTVLPLLLTGIVLGLPVTRRAVWTDLRPG